MNALVSLLLRIARGERYEPPSERDTRLWLSFLATFPLVIGLIVLTLPWADDASLLQIWAALVVLMLVQGALWRAVYMIRQRWIRLAIIVVGWGVVLSYLGHHFILLMRS